MDFDTGARSRSSRVAHIDRHLGDGDLLDALRVDVRRGLTSHPKQLPSKWFYDDRGSALFDRITELDVYYLTRRERAILDAHATEIAHLAAAETLIDIGLGSAGKSVLLLDALAAAGTLRCYVPFDVSEAAIMTAARLVSDRHPAVEIHGLIDDFERHLDQLPHAGRRLITFLGSTIGNFPPLTRSGFLAALRRVMEPGDTLLLGMDLVKDPERLIAAYDDDQGVTAAFNRNLLGVINRQLGGDIDPENFAHAAVWDAEAEWMEMRLRSIRNQVVHVADLDLVVPFAVGEEMRTEISAKFLRAGIERELVDAGLLMLRWWTDAAEDFACSLSQPA